MIVTLREIIFFVLLPTCTDIISRGTEDNSMFIFNIQLLLQYINFLNRIYKPNICSVIPDNIGIHD